MLWTKSKIHVSLLILPHLRKRPQPVWSVAKPLQEPRHLLGAIPRETEIDLNQQEDSQAVLVGKGDISVDNTTFGCIIDDSSHSFMLESDSILSIKKSAQQACNKHAGHPCFGCSLCVGCGGK